MSAHIADDLPLLLTGDATRDVVLTAASHLRVCADCQQELVSAVVAHASLMSAQRFAPEMVARDGAEVPEPAEDLPLPDLSPVFLKAREEANAPKKSPRARRALFAVAAAAVIGVGGGVTIAALNSGSSTSTRNVSLQAFMHGAVPATVTIVDNRTLRVDATKLRKLDNGHVYELWLTNRNRTGSMFPVGLLGNDNKAELTVNPKVIAQYSNFEVSVQRPDQTAYSGYSVLRGAYN